MVLVVAVAVAGAAAGAGAGAEATAAAPPPAPATATAPHWSRTSPDQSIPLGLIAILLKFCTGMREGSFRLLMRGSNTGVVVNAFGYQRYTSYCQTNSE